MSINSSIEWTKSTWNPITGCTKVSPGCAHCYAERMAKRLKAMGQPNYCNGFLPTTHPQSLSLPLTWKQPQMIFVNSMSDLFHESIPMDFLISIFKVMNQASWHTFQILTKRPERIKEIEKRVAWSDNIWMGVTVESRGYIYRINHLRACKARIKFISFEPLLGEVSNVDLNGIDWVIAGGESGPGARELKEQWVIQLKDICVAQHIPFFFKQWGGVHKKAKGRLLQGRLWDELPTPIVA